MKRLILTLALPLFAVGISSAGGFIYPPKTIDSLTVTDDIMRGSATNEISTDTTAGSGIWELSTAYLSGNQAAVEGSLLIATTTVAGRGMSVAVSLSVLDQVNVIGFAAADASTGNPVQFYSGRFAMGLTTGTVNLGDVVVSSNTGSGARGYTGVDNTPTSGADIGVVVGPRGTGDRTLIRLR
jgi:hypothetical protein